MRKPRLSRRSVLLSVPAVALARVPLPRAAPRPKTGPVRVYFLRGLFVGGFIFSRGLDALAEKLNASFKNVRASVHWNEEALFLHRDAAAVHTETGAKLVFIGHSAGADSCLIMAAAIAPMPVSLIVTIDPTRIAPAIPGNVQHLLNVYNSTTLLGGGAFRAERFKGRFEQVDLAAEPLLHIGMDKSPIVQGMITERIAALAGQ
jgi:hypothetical protein